MSVTINVLQDHTEFMERMIELAYDDIHGKPLSIPLLDTIRTQTVAVTNRKKVLTLGQLRELAEVEPKQARKIGMAMANAVEHDDIRWYCVGDDAGAKWLAGEHYGPVIRWGQGVWWGHLKGQKVNAEVVFHAGFKERKRSKSGRSETGAADATSYPRDGRSSGLFRPAVAELG